MLIEHLIERQKALDETDLVFAERLGISRTLWNLVKRGRMAPVNCTLLGTVCVHWPELSDDVLDFLRSSASKVA